MTTQLHTVAALRARADAKRAEVQSLLDKHGSGTRPSWVSTDLSLAFHAAEQAEREADILQLEQSDTVGELRQVALMIASNDRTSSLTQELFAARVVELRRRTET